MVQTKALPDKHHIKYKAEDGTGGWLCLFGFMCGCMCSCLCNCMSGCLWGCMYDCMCGCLCGYQSGFMRIVWVVLWVDRLRKEACVKSSDRT